MFEGHEMIRKRGKNDGERIKKEREKGR